METKFELLTLVLERLHMSFEPLHTKFGTLASENKNEGPFKHSELIFILQPTTSSHKIK